MVGDNERGGSSLQVVVLSAAALACSSHLPSTLITLELNNHPTPHRNDCLHYCQDCNFAPSDRERHRRGYCPLSPLSNTPEHCRMKAMMTTLITIVLLNYFGSRRLCPYFRLTEEAAQKEEWQSGQTTGPVDRTPGPPGSDKKDSSPGPRILNRPPRQEIHGKHGSLPLSPCC